MVGPSVAVMVSIIHIQSMGLVDYNTCRLDTILGEITKVYIHTSSAYMHSEDLCEI